MLLDIEGVSPNYQLVVTRTKALDELEIKVEVAPEMFTDEVGRLEKLRALIAANVKKMVGLSAKITLVEPGVLERSTGKAKRVIDLRNQQ